MTRSKLDLAKILVNLRNDGSDPETLAKDMTLRRLCFEIEKLEIEQEAPKEAPKEGHRSFWSFLTHDSSDED
jgi:hypothetical protein